MGKASNRKKAQNNDTFSLYGLEVKTGDWVHHLCPVIHQPVITRICDNKVARDGLMVWFYSPTYGEHGSEAGMMSKDYGPFRKCTAEEIASIPASVLERSDKFLKMCVEYDFQ